MCMGVLPALYKREHRKRKRLSESLELELQFSVRAVNAPNCKVISGSFLKLWFYLTEQRAEPVSSLHSLSYLGATRRQSPKSQAAGPHYALGPSAWVQGTLQSTGLIFS